MKIETYNEIYLRVRKALKQAGIETSDMESKFIVASAMGKTREQMLAMSKVYATDASIVNKIEQSLERRLKGEPLAYILEEWEFYGLTLKITKDVLIPRTDTELLAQEAIKLIKRKMWKTRVLDLCAGSGCVGLAVAANIPACRVVMADISSGALAVCRKNTVACGLSRNAAVIEADALKAPPSLIGAFDAIICNPPYIPAGDIGALDSSVRDYEPAMALDGGEDGLKFFHSIASKWPKVLKPGGHMAFECGAGQADEVRYIMKKNGFDNITAYKDTLKTDRVITGKKI